MTLSYPRIPQLLFGFRSVPMMLLALWLMGGCAHGPLPYLPTSWSDTSIPKEALIDKRDESKLQVIIMYNGIACSHTAVRLVTADRPVLFWDPGGGYGTYNYNPHRAWVPGTGNENPHHSALYRMDRMEREKLKNNIKRYNDIIQEDAPDLLTYLDFRVLLDDRGVEIFEWQLTLQQAHEFYDVLMNGTNHSHPAGKFNSSTAGMFCSVAASDFLKRFAGDVVKVPKKYFFPHNLSQILYAQSPDRVIIYRIQEDVLLRMNPPTFTRENGMAPVYR